MGGWETSIATAKLCRERSRSARFSTGGRHHVDRAPRAHTPHPQKVVIRNSSANLLRSAYPPVVSRHVVLLIVLVEAVPVTAEAVHPVSHAILVHRTRAVGRGRVPRPERLPSLQVPALAEQGGVERRILPQRLDGVVEGQRVLVLLRLILVHHGEPLVVVRLELALPDLCRPILIRLGDGVEALRGEAADRAVAVEEEVEQVDNHLRLLEQRHAWLLHLQQPVKGKQQLHHELVVLLSLGQKRVQGASRRAARHAVAEDEARAEQHDRHLGRAGELPREHDRLEESVVLGRPRSHVLPQQLDERVALHEPRQVGQPREAEPRERAE
mmetsp:Transcript_37386/g.112589  ORF Transcript_37386/g.112589 Transcript_37386/m.112589 type:complete len:327 (+) Transcript_37386:21-1001(+)